MTKGEQKVLIGVTENGKQIICKISDGNYQVGEFVKVKVINAFPFKLG
ncbi:hypothetical protein KKG31_03385 [Patescibacteria group bacterium]|nr:hypothetical protein [Patescibacteria group bacterium]MBU1758190.1 hypothetical protein [Patescibacteria group bacterium]